MQSTPLPDNTMENNTFILELDDGRVLRYAIEKITHANHKGTVVILEGFGETIEKYHETLEDLKARHFNTAIFDWSGQGGSTPITKTKSRSDGFDVNQDIEDLNQFLKTVVYPDLPAPYYILSYDMGALLALSALEIIGNQFYRLICVAPLLAPCGHKFDGLHHRYIQFLSDIGLGRLSAKSYQRLTHKKQTESRNARYKSTQSQSNNIMKTPTFNWVCNVLNASRNAYIQMQKGKLHIPTFFILANQDKVSDERETRRFCNNVRLADSLTIMGASHDLLMEEDRYRMQFWAAFDAFIPGSISELELKSIEPNSFMASGHSK